MTRKEARSAGRTTYHGKECKHGHGTERYVSTSACISCIKQSTSERSPDVYRKYVKSDKGSAWLKEFRRSSTYRAVQNRWSTRTGFHREQQMRRRAQMLDGMVSLTEDEKSRIKEIYHEASMLTQNTGISHHVDHVKQLSEGGLHHPDNLQILTDQEHWLKCAEENKQRNRKCV